MAGKSRIVHYLQRIKANGYPAGLHPTAGFYETSDWFFQEVIKDPSFSYIKNFNFVTGSPDRVESFIVGKEMSLACRLADTRNRILVDRFLITPCVYSHVFREFPVIMGEKYLEEMIGVIEKSFSTLKDRLRFFVILPDIEKALSEGIKGREGKDKEDGMEDNRDKLTKQWLLYQEYGLMLRKHDFNVQFEESYHNNPDVAQNILEKVNVPL